ncbi:M56 family peptidase, partial [Streptomyces sp. SID12501]|nr:M56 family peptidase [Streptomyces sp. SID12501]
LRAVRDTIRLAAERAADETAATAVGDRRLIATAIARAALAGHASPSTRPDFAPAATTGPVPQRVAALLAPSPARSRTRRPTALLLVACTALSLAAGTTGVVDFHHQVEIAQGEESP